VTTYLRHYEAKDEEDFWAFEAVSQIFSSGDAERAWKITCALVDRASGDALGYVAAGPLENYLWSLQIPALEQAAEVARKNRKMQIALSGVGVERSEPIWDRWVELMNEFGFPEVPDQMWIDDN